MIKAKHAVQCTAIEGHPELTEQYLDPFAYPLKGKDGDRICVKCGKRLSVRWGLAHGEVFCTDCGYPGRHYHFIDGKRTEFTLQYHPKVLTRRRSK